MQTFLGDVLDDLILKKESLSKYVLILPSKRAGVFLKNELKNKVNAPLILPEILSIEDFITELSSVTLIETTTLLFEFYTVYKNNTPKDQIETFEIFSKWAAIALKDFNEIDRHSIDPNYLFSYLQDIDRIDNWDIENETEFTKKYFAFFEKLQLYYHKLYEGLLSKKQAYQGMQYREAVENLPFYIDNNPNRQLAFIGFNALNTSEEYIIKHLLDEKIATIYWDSDSTYFSPHNQTGTFLKKYQSTWSYFEKESFNWIKNHFNDEKNINVIGAPKNITQLKHVGELLGKQSDSFFESTALVLADESLLPVALSSLPKNVTSVNITMGYGLNNIDLSNLFLQLFKLHLNSKNGSFYYKDVLTILNHSGLKNSFDTGLISNNILKYNFSYLNYATLKKFNSPKNQDLLDIIFMSIKDEEVSLFLSRCTSLIALLKTNTSVILEKEFLFKFYKIFRQLETLNNSFGHIQNIKTLQQFFSQLLRNEKLFFQGEPLSGLQLMGVLETRALDFENIVITSVNEGVLPAGNRESSFIPYDVKKEVGLPTYQEKDAIFSYHFFRLLQRAKNIYLLYNTENDHYGSGEQSRFITQLEINTNLKIKKQVVSSEAFASPSKLKTIDKNQQILTTLKQLAVKGFSPTALTSYMYNPIDFYKQKILKIQEVDEIEETLAANTLGTIIHKALEVLYTPYIGILLTTEAISTMKANIPQVVKTQFEKEYKNGNISSGKNLLIFNIAKHYIATFLDNEFTILKNGHQLKIVALEQKLEANIYIEDLHTNVKLKGEIDRIDELNGVTRIIDYKTGKVDQKKVTVTEWEAITTDYDRFSKSFQLLSYAYLLNKNKRIDIPIEAGIISFKNLKAGLLKFTKKESDNNHKQTLITEQMLQEFEQELKKLIVEIFDISAPFAEQEITTF